VLASLAELQFQNNRKKGVIMSKGDTAVRGAEGTEAKSGFVCVQIQGSDSSRRRSRDIVNGGEDNKRKIQWGKRK
jgi:hypothetical protein